MFSFFKKIKMGGCFTRHAQPTLHQCLQPIQKPGQRVSSDLLQLNQCLTAEKRTFNGKTRFVKVSSVYDGDTVNIITNLTPTEPFYEYALRLHGIDTPELKPALALTHREAHILAAQKARDALKTLVLNKLCLVDFTKEDKYGRLLGTLWTLQSDTQTKNINVNQWLLENRFALPYTGKGPKPVFQTTL
jgi:endonuclease YncB( thermonuclease family)